MRASELAAEILEHIERHGDVPVWTEYAEITDVEYQNTDDDGEVLVLG